MPNYCDNRITISVEYEMHRYLLDELEQEIKTKNEFLNVLRPMPSEGVGNEWRSDNWGTKWEMDFTVTRMEDDLIITGTTAWCPPVLALKYYQDKNPNVSIHCLYFEGGMCFCGHTTFEPGVMTEKHISDFNSISKDEWLRDKTELGVFVCNYIQPYWELEEGQPDDPIIPESSDIGGLDTR